MSTLLDWIGISGVIALVTGVFAAGRFSGRLRHVEVEVQSMIKQLERTQLQSEENARGIVLLTERSQQMIEILHEMKADIKEIRSK